MFGLEEKQLNICLRTVLLFIYFMGEYLPVLSSVPWERGSRAPRSAYPRGRTARSDTESRPRTFRI